MEILATIVPEFNAKTGTIFHNTNHPIPPALNELENRLKELKAAAQQIDDLRQAPQQNVAQVRPLYEKFQADWKAFNQFLLEHQHDVLRAIKPDVMTTICERNKKMIESINIDPVPEATEAKKGVLAQLGTCLAASAVLGPLGLLGLAGYAACKKLKSAARFHIPKTADCNWSGGDNIIVHDPNFATHYLNSRNTTIMLYQGTPESAFEKVVANTLGDIALPLYGPNSSDPQAEKFSILAIAKEVFGKTAHGEFDAEKFNKHVKIDAQTGTIKVSWFNDEEKNAWISQLRQRNNEYQKWQQTNTVSLQRPQFANNQVRVGQGPQQPPAAQQQIADPPPAYPGPGLGQQP